MQRTAIKIEQEQQEQEQQQQIDDEHWVRDLPDLKEEEYVVNQILKELLQRYSPIQDSISVEYIPPDCQPYLFRWLPLGVSTSAGIGPQVNKFE